MAKKVPILRTKDVFLLPLPHSIARSKALKDTDFATVQETPDGVFYHFKKEFHLKERKKNG